MGSRDRGQRVCLGAVFYCGHNDFPGFFLAIPSHSEIVVAQAFRALQAKVGQVDCIVLARGGGKVSKR
jgi:hypothetical protein